jgi:hypothetical protein
MGAISAFHPDSRKPSLLRGERPGTSVTLWTREIRCNSLRPLDDLNFTRDARLFSDQLRFCANHTLREMARERQIPRPWYVGWALVPVTERWLKSLNQRTPLRQVRGILFGYGYSETCLSQTWSPTLGPSCRVLARHG